MKSFKVFKAVPTKLAAAIVVALIMVGGVVAHTIANRMPATDSSSNKTRRNTAATTKVADDSTATPTTTSGQSGSASAKTNNTTTAQASSTTQTKTGTQTTTKPGVAIPPAYAPYVQPPLMITSVTITGDFTIPAGACGSPSFRYGYDILLNGGKGPVTINTTWEYELTGPGQFTPSITPMLQGYQLPGGGRMYNSPYDAPTYLSTSTASGYRARLHVTSPNNIYSGWVNIPQAVSC